MIDIVTKAEMSMKDGKLNPINFDLSLSEFYKVGIVYILKCIFTLGIYIFYGANKIRGYLTNKFSLAGDNFAYHGRARELFFGFVSVTGMIYLPLILCYLFVWLKNIDSFSLSLWSDDQMVNNLGHVFVFLSVLCQFLSLVFAILSPYLIIKYRASRISWRGVFGRLDADWISYLWLAFVTFLNMLLLNIFAPYIDVKRKSYIWNNLHFGNNKFNVNVSPKSLMMVNIITMLLAIPTLFISRFWYYAALDRHIYAGISLNGLKMRSLVAGGGLAGLQLLNVLLLIVTLGIATPWIIKRNMKFYTDNHAFIGSVNDLDLSVQNEGLVTDQLKDYSFGCGHSLFGYIGWF